MPLSPCHAAAASLRHAAFFAAIFRFQHLRHAASHTQLLIFAAIIAA